MNKIIIIFFLLFVCSTTSVSNPVDMETAKVVAQNFMSKERHTSRMVSDVVYEKCEGQNSLYVVNFREGGWVMVSADDFTVPVLAFSLDGTYRTEDVKPDGFLYLVEEYDSVSQINKLIPCNIHEIDGTPTVMIKFLENNNIVKYK